MFSLDALTEQRIPVTRLMFCARVEDVSLPHGQSRCSLVEYDRHGVTDIWNVCNFGGGLRWVHWEELERNQSRQNGHHQLPSNPVLWRQPHSRIFCVDISDITSVCWHFGNIIEGIISSFEHQYRCSGVSGRPDRMPSFCLPRISTSN